MTYSKDDKLALLDSVEFKKHFQAGNWEDYNRQFFNALAPKYDFLNQVLSFGRQNQFKKKAIERAAIKPGDHVLDVCTGSGDMALWIAEKYPACRVTGIDVAENMLEIARRRTAHLPNVTFKKADAMSLDFEDHFFDVTLISFGLRNLRDLEEGLLELKRVTRPGGKLVNLDLGKPRGSIRRFLYQLYFGRFIPFLGKTLFHRGEFNSFQYLPSSNRYFPEQDELAAILQKLGFQNVRNYDYMFGAVAQQVALC